jgi:excisionase family DNA binding protein
MGATSMTDERIYTVQEVAEKLRVKPQTVRRMITDGELLAFKIRDEWRIKQSDLDRIMQPPNGQMKGE